MNWTFKAKKAKAQVEELDKALKDAYKKSKEDAKALKELQKTNEILLTKYLQNEQIL